LSSSRRLKRVLPRSSRALTKFAIEFHGARRIAIRGNPAVGIQSALIRVGVTGGLGRCWSPLITTKPFGRTGLSTNSTRLDPAVTG
jgi:hypothetical protein